MPYEIPQQTPVQDLHFVQRETKASCTSSSRLNSPSQQIFDIADVLPEFFVVLSREAISVEEGPQEELFHVVLLYRVGGRTKKPFLQI